MSPTTPYVIRGRCACGRRYRIRNAQPGVTVQCPNCRRAIPITHADIEAASAQTRLIPIQDEQIEPREAILVDYGELTLAADGSRPGATGREVFGHDEAALFCAQRGLRAAGTIDSGFFGPPPSKQPFIRLEAEPVQRSFWPDLLAGLSFCGSINVAVNVLAMGLFALLLVQLYWATPALLRILVLPIVLVLWLPLNVQFYWSIMRRAAFGEERAPIWGVEAGVWYDMIKPSLWILVISAICFLPAMIVTHFVGASGSGMQPIVTLVVVLGWFFWPLAVLSVGLGDSPVLLRPDWLIRCLIAIGPAYILIWLVVIFGEIAGYVLTTRLQTEWCGAVMLFALRSYTTYLVFRTLGVFYRHRRHRFPWFV